MHKSYENVYVRVLHAAGRLRSHHARRCDSAKTKLSSGAALNGHMTSSTMSFASRASRASRAWSSDKVLLRMLPLPLSPSYLDVNSHRTCEPDFKIWSKEGTFLITI